MCQDDKSFYDLIAGRRTIRSFKSEPVSRDLLERLVDVGRLAPSAANLQPLEFIVVDEAGPKAEIFSCLKWAAYIAPAGDPNRGRSRPPTSSPWPTLRSGRRCSSTTSAQPWRT